MVRKLVSFIAASTVSWLAIAPASAADTDWPNWRGPIYTGEAPKADPPTEWSDSKNIRWKVAVPGRGHASPIVWGDRIYLITSIETDRTAALGDIEIPPGGTPTARLGFAQDGGQPPPPPPGESGERRRQRGEGGGGRGGRPGAEKPTKVHQYVVMAFDRNTGKTIWEKTVREAVPHAGMHQDSTHASASPVTDGELIFAFFGSAGLYCLDSAGNVKWEKDLGRMQTRNSFGEGASPAIHGDTLVVNWDHEGEDFIAAFEKKTGKELWRKERNEATTWTTPLIVETGGKAQVIIPATAQCRAYDLKTGEQIWECKGLTGNVIPTAVQSKGIVYLISGFRGAALKAVKLSEAKGDITDNKAAIIWSTTEEKTPYVPSPVLVGDCLYFLDNNKAVLTCLNAATGEKHYGPERIEGIQGIYASPVAAGNRLYFFGRDGKAAVIKCGPKFEVIAQNAMEDSFDATPALVGNEIILRGKSHLYSIAKP